MPLPIHGPPPPTPVDVTHCPAYPSRLSENARKGAETRVALRTGEAHVSLVGSHMRSTYTATPSDIEAKWFVVDAEGMVLGRLATEVARIIRGKHKPMFTPHMDTGDNVIVINASKIRVTGRKAEQKNYFRHTGYMGHELYTPFASMLAKHPERVIEKAVYGMLPKTALGRQKLRLKLRVYADARHPHAAQQPETLTFPHAEAK